jgi:hypothetical protein
MFEAVRNEVHDAIRGFDQIIDAHEHLPPEKDRLAMEPDACFLFSHYLIGTLQAAGCTPGDRGDLRTFLLDTSIPFEDRWAKIEPYLTAVRYTSYAEAMWRTLREVYGFDDITPDNLPAINAAMRAANKPGIYEEILVGRCRIKYALTQAGRTDYPEPFLVPILPLGTLHDLPEGRETVEKRAAERGMTAKTLSEYLDVCRAQLAHLRDKERVVGLKMISHPYTEPMSDEDAAGVFAKMMDGTIEPSEAGALNWYLRDRAAGLCGEADLTVAVHAGVWGDFRILDPRHNIPIIARYPGTRFDIYHMGIPYVRDTAIMGGNWPNVYENWAWAHIASYYMTQSGMPEYVDFVPATKILAFGGDYGASCVEKVVGHLSMAQENVATALARMVVDRRMSVEGAIELAHMWFYDNPVELYRLDRFG